jgi:ribosomal-protein-alanine N-acetyltransferase
MCDHGPDATESAAADPRGLRFERMTEHDLDAVLVIEQASFPSPWKREHFLHELHENPWAESFVVRAAQGVVGYASAWCVDAEFRINTFAVHPERRRSGLGRWLMERLLGRAIARGCRRAALEVRVSNLAARSLYRSQGFVESGHRKNYYALEGEDAIVMTLDLPPGPKV